MALQVASGRINRTGAAYSFLKLRKSILAEDIRLQLLIVRNEKGRADNDSAFPPPLFETSRRS